MNLVNKDQVDILASLRESVSEDKALLEAETGRLKQQIKELGEKNRMQLEQVNVLLLEKVNLQSESIGQRERMLQRERDIGFVHSFFVPSVPLRMCIQGPTCLPLREGYTRGCQDKITCPSRRKSECQGAAEDYPRQALQGEDGNACI